jgi:hypothetical protein
MTTKTGGLSVTVRWSWSEIAELLDAAGLEVTPRTVKLARQVVRDQILNAAESLVSNEYDRFVSSLQLLAAEDDR